MGSEGASGMQDLLRADTTRVGMHRLMGDNAPAESLMQGFLGSSTPIRHDW